MVTTVRIACATCTSWHAARCVERRIECEWGYPFSWGDCKEVKLKSRTKNNHAGIHAHQHHVVNHQDAREVVTATKG